VKCRATLYRQQANKYLPLAPLAHGDVPPELVDRLLGLVNKENQSSLRRIEFAFTEDDDETT
jgi:hypothetical protein